MELERGAKKARLGPGQLRVDMNRLGQIEYHDVELRIAWQRAQPFGDWK